MTKLPANLLNLVSNLENDDLTTLARLIIARRKQIQMRARSNFRVGQKVKFDAKSRGIVSGYVVKINPRTIKVMADSGVMWKVSPSFLKAI